MTKQTTPTLRFKDFDNEWKKSIELNSVIKKQFKGKAKQDKLNNGSVMYLDANALNGDTPFMSDAKKDTAVDDVLIMWDGSNAGKVFTGFEGALGSTLKGYQINDSNNSNFVFNYLVKHQQKIYEQYRTPNIPHVIKNFTEAFKISSPSLPEQSAIGSLFHTLDELLSAYKDNLANYQAFKASMLSKMFPKVGQTTPEIRLEGFDGEWEEKKLGELADILDGDRGKNYPTESDFSMEGHTLFLSANNITKHGFIADNCQYISREKSESMGNGKINLNDIVLTSRGTVGNISLFNREILKLFPNIRINSGMLILRIKDCLDSRFLIQYLKSSSGYRQIEKISFGSAQPQLTKKGVTYLKVFIPSSPEQQAIGSFFSNLDELISTYQEKIDQLETLKKKLLQDMFV